jgi:IclR family transcriptional regulator, KDG regulon repressor
VKQRTAPDDEREAGEETREKQDLDYTIRVLDQAVTVLQTLARHSSSTITEIAAETGYTKSLVFRILFTLEKKRLVIKDRSSRTYRLGHQPLALASKAREQSMLLQVADPLLDELAGQGEETVSLVVRDGLNAIYLSVRDAPLPVRLFARTGRRGPLHVGAGPKVLLAFAPPEVREAVLRAPLPRYTPATITDPKTLAAVIEHVRRTGLSENYSDLDNHAFGFAAPIWDRSGSVTAALSIAGALSRLTPDRAELLKHRVVDYAHSISNALGWTG